jgi:AI-2 transport protein TqsA
MSEPPPSPWRDPDTLRTVAVIVVIACGSWWLLGQLAVVLRPLLVAVFLAYVLLPTFMRFRKTMPGPVGFVALAGLTAAILSVMAVVTYASLLGVLDEFPKIQARAIAIAHTGGDFVDKNLPWLVPDRAPAPKADEPLPAAAVPDRRPEVVFAERIVDLAKVAAGGAAVAAASAIGEAAVAGLYLFFLLLEASRFPTRVRGAYDAERAEHILHVFGRISGAIIGYLKAKVLSGLVTALLAAIVLWAFGVRFVFLWAVLTFLMNFIPYVGTVFGFGLPAIFAGLMLEGTVPPVACAILLLLVHVVTGTFVEPLLIGKAVGLSPLVILVALTIWGTLWGLPGMFLAVPLTMVVLIVLDNVPSTKPFARLVLT